jgi:hypothetical protein
VSADVVVGIQPDDQVTCRVGNPSSDTEDYRASNQGNAAIWATIPINAVVEAAVNDVIGVNCWSLSSNGKTDFYEASLNAILIDTSAGPDNGLPVPAPGPSSAKKN